MERYVLNPPHSLITFSRHPKFISISCSAKWFTFSMLTMWRVSHTCAYNTRNGLLIERLQLKFKCYRSWMLCASECIWLSLKWRIKQKNEEKCYMNEARKTAGGGLKRYNFRKLFSILSKNFEDSLLYPLIQTKYAWWNESENKFFLCRSSWNKEIVMKQFIYLSSSIQML